MDLFVKWLGLIFSIFVFSICVFNVYVFERGFQRIWECLYDRYGCLEMVEVIIKKKLDNFLKFLSKEMNRFYDLLDILLELEFIKFDVYYL